MVSNFYKEKLWKSFSPVIRSRVFKFCPHPRGPGTGDSSLEESRVILTEIKALLVRNSHTLDSKSLCECLNRSVIFLTLSLREVGKD